MMANTRPTICHVLHPRKLALDLRKIESRSFHVGLQLADVLLENADASAEPAVSTSPTACSCCHLLASRYRLTRKRLDDKEDKT